MTRRLTLCLLPLALAAALALLDPGAAALGWRAAFLAGSAPVLGAVLLLLIGRVVGADWAALQALAAPLPVIALATIPLAAAQLAAPLPEHLALWANPGFVGLRGLAAVAALGYVAARLRHDASRSFASVALALWVVLATPLAFDWLLGATPGHAVSAAGMLLATEQVGGACAAFLALGMGSARLRHDMAGLLIAVALGTAYLAFMDYLIVWYGDLPHRAQWYVARAGAAGDMLAAAALLLGLVAPIAALARGPAGQRLAGSSALAGLLLFQLWWVGAGLRAAMAAVLLTAAIAAGCALPMPAMLRRAHGRA